MLQEPGGYMRLGGAGIWERQAGTKGRDMGGVKARTWEFEGAGHGRTI